MNEYILIGILMAIIVSLFVMIVILINLYEKRMSDHVRRYLVMDTHHRSEKRYLTLLLLETKGIATGVKTTAKLYSNYIEEIKTLEDVEEYSKNELKKTAEGK